MSLLTEDTVSPDTELKSAAQLFIAAAAAVTSTSWLFAFLLVEKKKETVISMVVTGNFSSLSSINR